MTQVVQRTLPKKPELLAAARERGVKLPRSVTKADLSRILGIPLVPRVKNRHTPEEKALRKAQNDVWRKNNPEKLKEQRQRNYDKNWKKYRERNVAYRAAHPEKVDQWNKTYFGKLDAWRDGVGPALRALKPDQVKRWQAAEFCPVCSQPFDRYSVSVKKRRDIQGGIAVHTACKNL